MKKHILKYRWLNLLWHSLLYNGEVSDCGIWRLVRFYFAPVTFLLSAVLLRSWLSYCPGFDNDQTTCLLFETNVTKRPLGIGLEAFHRTSRSTWRLGFTLLLSAILLRSWLSYCPGFDNDQTTCLLFEPNVTKRPLGIGLEAFHRTSRSTRSNAILDYSKSPIILILKFLLLQSGETQVNPGPPKHPCSPTRKPLNVRNVFFGFTSTVLQCPLNLMTILDVILILSGYAIFVPFQTSLQLFFSTIWIALRVITVTRASNLTTLVRHQRRPKLLFSHWTTAAHLQSHCSFSQAEEEEDEGHLTIL